MDASPNSSRLECGGKGDNTGKLTDNSRPNITRQVSTYLNYISEEHTVNIQIGSVVNNTNSNSNNNNNDNNGVL